jgi:hypothetical protein
MPVSAGEAYVVPVSAGEAYHNQVPAPNQKIGTPIIHSRAP